MQLTSRIYLVGSGRAGFGLTNPFDCHTYLVDCGHSLSLIDAGSGLEPERIEAEIRKDGLAPERISHLILTHGHADHAGGAAHFNRRYGARVAASPEVAGFLRNGDEEAISLGLAKRAGIYPSNYRWASCPAAIELAHGQDLPIGDCVFRAIATPGHADGHLSLLLPTEAGDVLFAGDAVFHGGEILLQAIPDCSIWRYRETIARLAQLQITTLLPGHLALALGDGQAHIAAAERAFTTLLPPRNAL